jgi:hypothetical protein
LYLNLQIELLFLVGGWIGEDIGGSIESFDPIKGMWQMVGEMPEPSKIKKNEGSRHGVTGKRIFTDHWV